MLVTSSHTLFRILSFMIDNDMMMGKKEKLNITPFNISFVLINYLLFCIDLYCKYKYNNFGIIRVFRLIDSELYEIIDSQNTGRGYNYSLPENYILMFMLFSLKEKAIFYGILPFT